MPDKITLIFGDYTCNYECNFKYANEDTITSIIRSMFGKFMRRVYKHHQDTYELQHLVHDMSCSTNREVQQYAERLNGVLND